MSNQIFTVRPLINRSLLQRLFKQQPKENALYELNNMLATRSLLSISHEDIAGIESTYAVQLINEFPLNLEEFYAVYWNYAIKIEDTDKVTKAEHLGTLLKLPGETVRNLQEQISEQHYKKAALSRLRKRRLEEIDIMFLAEYGRSLALSPDTSGRLLQTCQEEVLNSYIESLQRSQRCSPESQVELEETMRSFAVSPAVTKRIRRENAPRVHNWQLENLPLQPINVSSIVLQKSETCYFVIEQVQWMEMRSAGKYGSSLELIQKGTLYLTNKRLVFDGHLKTSTLPYDRILQIKTDTKGVQLLKDKGKNPTLVLPQQQTAFEIVLKRLLTS